MTATLTSLRTITQPNNYRPGKNAGTVQIPRYRIVALDVTGVDQVALAVSSTDLLFGVTDIEIDPNGREDSIQVGGKAKVQTGAAFNIGDKLTSDSTGRAVPATETAASPVSILGRAVTASSGADDFAEVELRQNGSLYTSIVTKANRTAIKAIAASARFDGMLIMSQDDGSMWRFVAASVVTTDGADVFVLIPTAGTGVWFRVDKSFVARIPFTFATADAALILTVPEGFVARILPFPYWEVSAAFTGGATPGIGVSTTKAGYNTKGDILGGAGGDLTAGLTAGVKLGTQGTKLDTLAHLQALLLVEADSLRFDRIASAFTAGAGNVMVPMIIDSAGPVTP